jgi:hypothetical protein
LLRFAQARGGVGDELVERVERGDDAALVEDALYVFLLRPFRSVFGISPSKPKPGGKALTAHCSPSRLTKSAWKRRSVSGLCAATVGKQAAKLPYETRPSVASRAAATRRCSWRARTSGAAAAVVGGGPGESAERCWSGGGGAGAFEDMVGFGVIFGCWRDASSNDPAKALLRNNNYSIPGHLTLFRILTLIARFNHPEL